MEPGTSHTQSECVTSAPLSQLRVVIVDKLFNCIEAMSGSVNKKANSVGHSFSTNSIFCTIFTCQDNYILQFLILMGVGFTA